MAGNKKPRGMRVTPMFKPVLNDQSEMEMRAFGTKRIGQRLGKNTRQSDLERTKRNTTHTSPVSRVTDGHMDETGAYDPSRIRHANTKAMYNVRKLPHVGSTTTGRWSG